MLSTRVSRTSAVVKKSSSKQKLIRRAPQQARSRAKIELILEASTRLIERDGIQALTTNAIAETTGLSIGTLYQYFDGKESIVRALVQREMAKLSARVMEVMNGPAPPLFGGRATMIVSAVLDSYGGRQRAHRLLIEHALTRGTADRLSPLFGALVEQFSAEGIQSVRPTGAMSEAEAFVFTHAIVGVLRALVSSTKPPPRAQVEHALTRLVRGYFAGAEREELGN